ncbi:DUF4957 domain-containing protein [Pinibacter aurantiacus]|uniref:Fibronectin type III domain-containing protein n=1 Tax=Pinibacter aurantiacus TaxID=2851599 RepID=A0A9E2S7H9_9BACT|nr:DUF4957 domain-containing protein [Pinibacter aurantiacus]MBV4357296.1 fibronectin type III domain-containing protein [Pinibacter aurantiacus]
MLQSSLNKILFGILTTMIIGAVACKKDDPSADLQPPRLFKPSGVSVKTDSVSAHITWDAPLRSGGQTINYTAEISTDSNFATTSMSVKTDTTAVTITEDQVALRTKYFIRVKANTYEDQPESKWLNGASFAINGVQIFLPIRETELTENKATLRWRITPGLTDIKLAVKGGTSTTHTLTADELSTGMTSFTGLVADTGYYAEIFAGTKSRGFLNFRTGAPTVYSTILNPGDDIAAAINNAANNDIIGLNPGTYDAGNTSFVLMQKTITLKSTSNDPTDTKVNFKEFTLRGNGAGIKLYGIDLDGTPSGALYFINLTGVAADAELATYTQVIVDNCKVHGAATSFMRANRGANAGDYKMDLIKVNNSIIYNVATGLSYNCFHLDKLEFKTMQVTKSTFYNVGQALASSSTVLINMPSISFDHCTINNLGGKDKYVLMDANANPVRFSITNSIVANIPLPNATVQATTIRANGAGTSLSYTNNNHFKLTNGKTTADLAFPTSNITMIGNNTLDLGWTAETNVFYLPQNSILRTVSSTGGAIGDPRWTY